MLIMSILGILTSIHGDHGGSSMVLRIWFVKRPLSDEETSSARGTI